MTHLLSLQRLLAFVTLVLFLACCRASAESWTVYDRAEQTDADYAPERIEELIERFISKDEEKRASAFWELEALGPEARPAIPKLIEQLGDKTSLKSYFKVGRAASLTLVAMQADAVACLVKAFPQASPEAKYMIAETACSLGSDARELVPLFRQQYVSMKSNNRLQYLWTLAWTDPTGEIAFPSILIALRNAEDEHERRLAAECLRLQGFPEYDEGPSQARHWYQRRKANRQLAVNALLQALRDEEPMVRAAAIHSLAGYTAEEKQIVPELIRLLDDDTQYIVRLSGDVILSSGFISDEAAGALISFRGSVDTITPAVVGWALRDGTTDKSNADRILADLIPSSNQPIEYVKQLLQSQEPQMALLTMARIGKAAQSLIPQVETIATSDDVDVALQARLTLACIDSRYQPEALKLLNRDFVKLTSGEKQHWYPASDFLSQVGRNAVFAKPIFETALATPVPPEFVFEEYREEAAAFLAGIGASSSKSTTAILSVIDLQVDNWYVGEPENALVKMCPEIIPDLMNTLGDESSSKKQKIACLRVLGAAHADEPELVPLIITQLKSDHPALRESAVQALAEIGTKNEQSLKALIKALDDPRVRVRAKALESLAKLGDKAEPAVPKIVKCLADDYLTVRVAAVRCLGELGQTAASAIDELEKLKDSESLLLRETVDETLAQIRL